MICFICIWGGKKPVIEMHYSTFQNTGSSVITPGRTSAVRVAERWTGCPEGLWSILWRYSRPDWMPMCATCSDRRLSWMVSRGPSNPCYCVEDLTDTQVFFCFWSSPVRFSNVWLFPFSYRLTIKASATKETSRKLFQETKCFIFTSTAHGWFQKA